MGIYLSPSHPTILSQNNFFAKKVFPDPATPYNNKIDSLLYLLLPVINSSISYYKYG